MTQNAPALDLDAELTADAELVKNEARDAVGLGRTPMRIESQVERINAKQRRQYTKVVAQAKRALKLSAENQHSEAARVAWKAVNLAPELALTNHVMGLMLYRLGRLSRSLDFFQKAWEIDPKDAEIYQKLGLVAWKLDMLEAAEKFYRIECQLAPNNANALINLAGVLRDQSKFAEAIEILRTAIYAHPENHELWNSMGTVVNDSGNPQEAQTFYLEALRLKPSYGRAHNNMANVYELLGEPEKALPHYVEALKDPADETEEATMRHSRSMVLLAAGKIAEGWEANAARLDPNRAGATLFSMQCPMWDGADPAQIRGKKLLVVGEQGLGDEVLFMSIIQDIQDAIGPDGELRIACEYRLMPLVKRSFPDAIVSNHLSATLEGREIRTAKLAEGADFWTPMASPLRAFRPSLESFPDRKGFLRPAPDYVQQFRDQIAGFGDGLKVGVLWKSLRMDAHRSKFFSAFDAWQDILRVEGVDFVNLQYGDVDTELALAEERFGVRIHQPTGIDLKMELDRVAALSSACDLVIGPMNATTNLAAACGTRVWFMHSSRSAWTLFGLDNRQPWYPHCRSFTAPGFANWDVIMPEIARNLSELASGCAA
jgi:tetratricopeptide (TPR) repeat protein